MNCSTNYFGLHLRVKISDSDIIIIKKVGHEA